MSGICGGNRQTNKFAWIFISTRVHAAIFVQSLLNKRWINPRRSIFCEISDYLFETTQVGWVNSNIYRQHLQLVSTGNITCGFSSFWTLLECANLLFAIYLLRPFGSFIICEYINSDLRKYKSTKDELSQTSDLLRARPPAFSRKTVPLRSPCPAWNWGRMGRSLLIVAQTKTNFIRYNINGLSFSEFMWNLGRISIFQMLPRARAPTHTRRILVPWSACFFCDLSDHFSILHKSGK